MISPTSKPQTQEAVAFHALAFCPWHYERTPIKVSQISYMIAKPNPEKKLLNLLSHVYFPLCDSQTMEKMFHVYHVKGDTSEAVSS